MRTKVLVLAVVGLASLRGWSQDAPDPQAASRIIALENAWSQAAAGKDLRALDTLLDGGFVYVDFDGRLMTKAEVLADVKAVHVQQFVTEGMTAHVYGNAAIVTGMVKMKGVENGKPFLRRGRFTDTWIYRSGAWACVASEATPILH
jgi:ketosteroid isomerase-like protein